MKKILTGCLIVIVIAMIGFGVAAFYAYRAMKPVIDNASNYLDQAREVTRLGDEIRIKTPYDPPGNGELTAGQVERFVAVQTRVRTDLDDQWAQIEKKSQAKTIAFADVATIWLDARRAQVKALNIQRFSEQEYEWVRKRVYEAAGVHLAGNMDLSTIEALARDKIGDAGVQVPPMDLPKIPEKNIELVKPHTAKIKEWIPMAVLGL